MSLVESDAIFTLFSVYHKAFPVPNVDFVKPIHVGKAISKIDLGFESDDTGENISALNPYFAELCGAYYVWKNYDASKIPYWGMCHYRRYFILPPHPLSFKKVFHYNDADLAFEKIFTPQYVSKINTALKNGKVVLNTPYRFIKLKKWSVRQQYIKDHDAESWNITMDSIKKLYPDYVDSVNEFASGLTCSWCNMLVASWQYWDEYLTWLFAVLFDVKAKMEADLKPIPLRIYAFLAERLLNAYLFHKQKQGQKVIYLPIADILK